MCVQAILTSPKHGSPHMVLIWGLWGTYFSTLHSDTGGSTVAQTMGRHCFDSAYFGNHVCPMPPHFGVSALDELVLAWSQIFVWGGPFNSIGVLLGAGYFVTEWFQTPGQVASRCHCAQCSACPQPGQKCPLVHLLQTSSGWCYENGRAILPGQLLAGS